MGANLGAVSQEPVLFDGSIAHNIRYGKPGVGLGSPPMCPAQNSAIIGLTIIHVF